MAPSIVRDLAHRLLEDLDDLAGLLVRRILATEASYAGTVPLEDLHRSVRDNLEQVIQAVAGDVADPARLAPAQATGRRRAEQGLPLESLLHSYRIGGRLIWERMVALARDRAPDRIDELLDGATQVWDAIDEFSTVVSESYRRTERHLARIDAERQAAVVEALLRGDATGATARRASELLGQFSALVVVVVERAGQPLTLEDPSHVLAAEGVRGLWQERPPGRVGVLAGRFEDLEDVAARALRAVVHGRAGMSTPVEELRELPRAHDLASLALMTAGTPPDVAVLGRRLRAAVAAASGPLGELLVERTIGRLHATGEADAADLLQTLQVYLEASASVAVAAERLYCHRNTVLNRLRRISQLTALDLRDPGDLSTIVLALDVRQAAAAAVRVL